MADDQRPGGARWANTARQMDDILPRSDREYQIAWFALAGAADDDRADEIRRRLAGVLKEQRLAQPMRGGSIA